MIKSTFSILSDRFVEEVLRLLRIEMYAGGEQSLPPLCGSSTLVVDVVVSLTHFRGLRDGYVQFASCDIHFWQLGFCSSHLEEKQRTVSDFRRHNRSDIFSFWETGKKTLEEKDREEKHTFIRLCLQLKQPPRDFRCGFRFMAFVQDGHALQGMYVYSCAFMQCFVDVGGGIVLGFVWRYCSGHYNTQNPRMRRKADVLKNKKRG